MLLPNMMSTFERGAFFMGFDEEINNNSVAQLDRAIAYEAKGCKFESYQNY